MKTFLAVDAITKEVVYTHSQEAFKSPVTDEYGNLHWYGYATDEALACSAWNIDAVMKGMFKEWCEKHNIEVGEGMLYKKYLEDYKMTEYEFIAPLMENA